MTCHTGTRRTSGNLVRPPRPGNRVRPRAILGRSANPANHCHFTRSIAVSVTRIDTSGACTMFQVTYCSA